MRAAGAFLDLVASRSELGVADGISYRLFGSLATTGAGHATDVAVIAGLAGAEPESVDPDDVPSIPGAVEGTRTIRTRDGRRLAFDPATDVVFRKREFLAGHPNALEFILRRGAEPVLSRVYYSVGGFVRTEDDETSARPAAHTVPYASRSADQLLAVADAADLPIAEMARRNEAAVRPDAEVEAKLDAVWDAMRACVARGLRATGNLPGGLGVRRRAASLHAALVERDRLDQGDPLRGMEWVNVYALAVNKENAVGGRVVTAPTTEAAGIIPAVLHYYERFSTGAARRGFHAFLLTAAAIGSMIKKNASISGADVGCQGEVGFASSMAAAALGGTDAQVENAAEIALEHNLGLTCDPVGGLVQIPCTGRNAVASVKAINAARLALHGDGVYSVSLVQAIETMRQTGRDMSRKYKETSTGGLAVNVPLC